jgi:hypothetical protein
VLVDLPHRGVAVVHHEAARFKPLPFQSQHIVDRKNLRKAYQRHHFYQSS